MIRSDYLIENLTTTFPMFFCSSPQQLLRFFNITGWLGGGGVLREKEEHEEAFRGNRPVYCYLWRLFRSTARESLSTALISFCVDASAFAAAIASSSSSSCSVDKGHIGRVFKRLPLYF